MIQCVFSCPQYKDIGCCFNCDMKEKCANVCTQYLTANSPNDCQHKKVD